MGKRQLGELQPFELVITLIVADLATVPMADANIPLISGVVPLITLLALHFFLSFVARKSITMRKIISGKPVIIIDPDGIKFNALKSLNMNINDLLEAMRCANYFSFDDILYGIIETNGTLTILPKSSKEPINSNDLKIKKQENALPMVIINDGKLMKDNIKISGFDKEKIDKYLSMAKIDRIDDVVVFTIDTNGKLFIQPKTDKSFSIDTEFKAGGKW